MAHVSGNPPWLNLPNKTTPLNATALEGIEGALDDFDPRIAALEIEPPAHAGSHAADGVDPVTPVSIGAVDVSRWLTGTGSPEGVLTAPVGTVYTDLSTGEEWHKMSGVGVTGWRGPIVLSDDPRLQEETDWIDLTLINGWVATNALTAPAVKRVGPIVYCAGQINGGAATAEAFAVIPAGYRPDSRRAAPFRLVATATVSDGVDGRTRGSDNTLIATRTADHRLYSTSWWTADPFPA